MGIFRRDRDRSSSKSGFSTWLREGALQCAAGAIGAVAGLLFTGSITAFILVLLILVVVGILAGRSIAGCRVVPSLDIGDTSDRGEVLVRKVKGEIEQKNAVELDRRRLMDGCISLGLSSLGLILSIFTSFGSKLFSEFQTGGGMTCTIVLGTGILVLDALLIFGMRSKGGRSAKRN